MDHKVRLVLPVQTGLMVLTEHKEPLAMMEPMEQLARLVLMVLMVLTGPRVLRVPMVQLDPPDPQVLMVR
jgi:hypothetical protein